MKSEELILGKSYRIKSKEWFDENCNENKEVIEDDVKFTKRYFCGESMKVNSLANYASRKGTVEMNFPIDNRKWNMEWIPVFALELDPNDKKELSKEIIQLVEEIKSYKFIYSSRNASGAGRGKSREMKNMTIRAGFNYEGKECIQLPGGDDAIPILWDLEKIRDLVNNKKVEHGWDATAHTHVLDSVAIGNTQEDMPRNFEWSSSFSL